MSKEIERKFLIAKPSKKDIELLDVVSIYDITQVYLNSSIDNIEERVRRKKDLATGNISFYSTKKSHISSLIRDEDEKEISREEYYTLVQSKQDFKKNIIYKTRYCINYESQLFELDIFSSDYIPELKNNAILEIELSSANQKISFIPQLQIIREVTDDSNFRNSNLASTQNPILEKSER